MGNQDTARFSPFATPSATRDVLERYGLALKKSLGQNFLVNDDVVGKILNLAEVTEDDFVLEVGPGIGTLTYALLDHAHAVVSIERDASLPEVLAETLAPHDGKFALIKKDALNVSRADIEEASVNLDMGILPNKVVSNLPYSVAATVVLDYFANFSSLDNMTVMVQREVAERMTAKPGTKNYGAYTVKLSLYAEYAGSFSVGPGNFMPPPHVESTVIRLNRVFDIDVDDALVETACTMADAAFAARRKTILNSCKQYFSGRDKGIASEIPSILAAAGIDPSVRGETLSKSQFIDLGRALLSVRP